MKAVPNHPTAYLGRDPKAFSSWGEGNKNLIFRSAFILLFATHSDSLSTTCGGWDFHGRKSKRTRATKNRARNRFPWKLQKKAYIPCLEESSFGGRDSLFGAPWLRIFNPPGGSQLPLAQIRHCPFGFEAGSGCLRARKIEEIIGPPVRVVLGIFRKKKKTEKQKEKETKQKSSFQRRILWMGKIHFAPPKKRCLMLPQRKYQQTVRFHPPSGSNWISSIHSTSFSNSGVGTIPNKKARMLCVVGKNGQAVLTMATGYEGTYLCCPNTNHGYSLPDMVLTPTD